MNSRAGRAAAGLALPLLLVAFWEYSAHAGMMPRYLIAPSAIMQSTYSMIASGELLVHARDSLQRSFSGFAIGSLLGIAIGLLAGVYRPVAGFFDPLVSLAYPVPKIAVLPILMSWLGIGDASKIAVIGLGVFFPVFINSFFGARDVNKLHVWSALNMGATRLQVFLRVVLPSAAPQVLTGLRIGLALSFILLFAAEMVGAKSGLGYLVIRAEDSLRFDLMYASILSIGVLGFASDRALVLVRRRLMAGRSAGHVDYV